VKTVTTVRDATVRWQGKEEPVDDQTMVVVRRDGGMKSEI
jgi:hypothetical protein